MNRTRDHSAWARQPVVWVGALILLASILGCVVTIVLAMRHGDVPVAVGGTVLNVPLKHPSSPDTPAREAK